VKKLISIITMAIMFLTMTGCDDKEKKPEMDPEAAGEFVVDYMKEKYDVDFEFETYQKEKNKDYAEIVGTIDSLEYKYIVQVELNDDNSYCIKYDSYFQLYIDPLVKTWISEVVREQTDLNNPLIFASLSYQDFGKDMTVPQNVEEFLVKKDKAGLYLYIIVPESEYTDDDALLNKYNKLLDYLKGTQMDCWGEIHVYNKENYDKVSKFETHEDYVNNMRRFNRVKVIDLFNK